MADSSCTSVRVGCGLPHAPSCRSTVKLTWRMDAAAAEALVANARALGLNYGQYVGYLVSATPLPVALRKADRAALMASNRRLADLAPDLHRLQVSLRGGAAALVHQELRDHVQTLYVDVQRHLQLATDFFTPAGEAP